MSVGQLAGRLALVTGAASGIGRSICEVFAREGARVAVVDVNSKGLEETLQLCSVLGAQNEAFTFDVSKSSQVNELMEGVKNKYSECPTVTVNCAGINRSNFLINMTEEEFDRVIEVNLKSAFLITQAVGRIIKEQRIPESSIINISSITAKTATFKLGNYTAAKAGMLALTKTTAREMAKFGVRCNAVMPGFIDTPMTGPDVVSDSDRQMLNMYIPMGRSGQPKEVAETSLFLASNRSSYITGACIEVTGGMDM